MKTFHGNLTPKSPNLRDRDASFSSYLRPDKPITCQPHHHAIGSGIRRALEDSTSELSIFDAHKYFNEVTNNETQKVTITSNSRVSPMIHTDMERIPERGDIITETTRYSSASSSVDGYAIIRNYRARSFHAATPTASSEASWNSQAGLLSHPKGAIPVSMKNHPNPNELNKKNRTTFTSSSLSKPIWLLRRKCPCTGKKSVQVKENIQQSKTQTTQLSQPPPEPAINYSLNNIKRHDHESKDVPNHITPNNWVVNQTAAATTFVATKSQRFNPNRAVTSVKTPFTDGFTFPVLNPNPNPNPKPHIPNGVVEEDPPRDSLEVFQPPENTVEPKSHAGAGAGAVDDAASDASSDLFEIESFSTATQSTYPIMYRRGSRDSFDEASSATNNGFFFGRRSMDEGSTTTTAYEPSEASIEWSVTTAEAHEDYIGGGGGGGVAAEKWKRKGGNGLLVSCRSEKAVSVGPQPVKCGTTPSMHVNHHVIVSGVGVNSNTSSSGSTRVGCVNKPPLAKSNRNTPRVSLAFAT